MKIAVTSMGKTVGAQMDARFGRCALFLIVDTEDMSVEVVDNTSGALSGGAGIQSARLMAEKGVQSVLTGNCGPNAHQTLTAAGIEVVVGCEGTVIDVVNRYKAGEFVSASAPNVESHAGMRGGR